MSSTIPSFARPRCLRLAPQPAAATVVEADVVAAEDKPPQRLRPLPPPLLRQLWGQQPQPAEVVAAAAEQLLPMAPQARQQEAPQR